MKCPSCKNGILYKAFTLAGDIGWCLKCDYRTEPDTSWMPTKRPELDLE